MKLSDLVPTPERLEISTGDIELKGLTVQNLGVLLDEYKDEILSMLGGSENVDLAALVASCPPMIAKVICMSSNQPGQEEFAAQLALQDQIDIITKVVELSVPNAKKLVQSLSAASKAMVGQVEAQLPEKLKIEA